MVKELPAIWKDMNADDLFPPVIGVVSMDIRAYYGIMGHGTLVLLVRPPIQKMTEQIDERFTVTIGGLTLLRMGTLVSIHPDEEIRTFNRNVATRCTAQSLFWVETIREAPKKETFIVEGYEIPIAWVEGDDFWFKTLDLLLNKIAQATAMAKEMEAVGSTLPFVIDFNTAEILTNYKEYFAPLVSSVVGLSFPHYPAGYYRLIESILDDYRNMGYARMETVALRLVDIANFIYEYNLAVYNAVKKILERDAKASRVTALLQLRQEIDNQLKALEGAPAKASKDESYLKSILAQVNERNLPHEVKEYITNEVERLLANINIMSMWVETEVTLRHIEFLLQLPWDRRAEAEPDMDAAERILNDHFYGMRTVKQKVLDFIATIKHTKEPTVKGTVLCFVGVPGTGKTDVSRVIAQALGRPFYRIPLGGVNDEAVIKGHRRTYVGAMPGNIMKALAAVGVKNPVILIDEVDKLGVGLRGDPAAALLDALDPDHNRSFYDHYVDFPFDLSEVVFICAANVWENINPTLRDRFERVDFAPYTPKDKIVIAKEYLLPRWYETLKMPPVEFTDEAILRLIREYTFEGGVRNLNSLLKVILQRRLRGVTPKKVRPQDIPKILWDIAPMLRGMRRQKLDPGVAPLLGVYPNTGEGELLYIEIHKVNQGKEVKWLTRCDETFKSSFETALIFASKHFNDPQILKDNYAVFKTCPGASAEGTSVGITFAVALVSLIEGRAIPPNIAFSGEIAPDGSIYEVGGIAQKVVLAETCGFTDLVLPARNKIDVAMLDFTPSVKIHFVKHMKEVLKLVGL